MVCGPAVRTELNKVLDTMQICPPRGPLPGLTWAIDNLHDWKAGNRAIIAERARVFREGVGQLPQFITRTHNGAGAEIASGKVGGNLGQLAQGGGEAVGQGNGGR